MASRPGNDVSWKKPGSVPVHPVVDVLRNERIRQGFSQQQVAQAVSFGWTTLTQWENGKIASPRIVALSAVAEMLGLEIVVVRRDQDTQEITEVSSLDES